GISTRSSRNAAEHLPNQSLRPTQCCHYSLQASVHTLYDDLCNLKKISSDLARLQNKVMDVF
ncbi:MAG: hypothetical protein ONB17_11275, partial [candidate division KSB1 bacterium]|nr:hypothetical protein [candidate division KSB1 bacterium]